MQCQHPYLAKTKGGAPMPVRCGRCTSCRIYRQQAWYARLLLEDMAHRQIHGPSSSSFLTLTYQEEAPSPSAMKRDFQLFMKRLRTNTQKSYRYFCIGERGGRTGRLHLHAILFGHYPNANAAIRFVGRHPHYMDPIISDTWQKGFTLTAPLSSKTMRYTSRYTLKGVKSGDHLFTLSSRRPAIGVPGLTLIAQQQEKYSHMTLTKLPGMSSLPNWIEPGSFPARMLQEEKNLPWELGYLMQRSENGKKVYLPLDSTMRKHLREMGVSVKEGHAFPFESPTSNEALEKSKASVDRQVRAVERTEKFYGTF